MSKRKLLGLVLILGGILGLVYGGFSFTRERHRLKLGTYEVGLDEKQHVSIPTWVGIVAVAGGAALLVAAKR